MPNAMYFAMTNPPPLETDYRYKADEGMCELEKNSAIPSIRGWRKSKAETFHESTMRLLQYGPLSCAVGVCHSWFPYGGGVLDTPCNEESVNHGILLVGYGVTNEGLKFWRIRNSWGNNWGIDGDILIPREVDDTKPQPHLLSHCYQPVF